MRLRCWLSLALGFWLYASRFFWVHSSQQFANTGTVGVLYTSLAVAAIGCPPVRYAHVVVAIWLCASAFALPRLTQATLWNNLLVSIARLVLTARPGGHRRVGWRRVNA